MKNIGVSAPVAKSGPRRHQQEDSMEFLVEFEVKVPAGTRDAEVEHGYQAERSCSIASALDGTP